ncbi:MAG: hypothetical protein ABSE73_13380 [Planctomycetota bacterium]
MKKTKHVVEITVKAKPALPDTGLVGQRGVGQLLFEAMAKALGSVGGYNDGVGFAEDAATNIKASFEKGDDCSLVFAVEVNPKSTR